MTQKHLTFLGAGFLVGLVTAVVGGLLPPMLTVGVGPLFSLGVIAAIGLTNSWRFLRRGVWRYIVAACISTIAYVVAFFTFSVVAGYAPDMFGIRASRDIVDLHFDVALGLFCGALVAAICTELIAYLLVGCWSNATLALFVLSGLLTVSATVATRRIVFRSLEISHPTYHSWAFLIVLFSVGEGLFCASLGIQILGRAEKSLA
jgi:uncharacterized membrane protein (DUF485 family)